MSAPLVAPPPCIIDIRSTSNHAERRGRREWPHVTGVCLHQTACVLGEAPHRYETLVAHIGITHGGKAVWVHDLDQVVWHGNGWNARTIGIEFDGEFAGVAGDPRTLWQPRGGHRTEMTPSAEQIEAGKEVIRWLAAEVAAHGGHVNALVAHRQASAVRRSDPGSAIWQGVALPLNAELGFTDGGRGFRLDDGYPIPAAWDPARDGIDY